MKYIIIALTAVALSGCFLRPIDAPSPAAPLIEDESDKPANA